MIYTSVVELILNIFLTNTYYVILEGIINYVQVLPHNMSPERSGSPQEEQVATPKMSVPASPVAGTPTREAQSPISLLLAVAQSQSNRNGDDDLTSLSWLHDRDLLKGTKN